jgi:hypothetical protein
VTRVPRAARNEADDEHHEQDQDDSQRLIGAYGHDVTALTLGTVSAFNSQTQGPTSDT